MAAAGEGAGVVVVMNFVVLPSCECLDKPHSPLVEGRKVAKVGVAAVNLGVSSVLLEWL